MMRKFLILGLALTMSLTACSSGNDTAAQQNLQKKADILAIAQIERNWHEASSTKNIDLMMSLWSDDATFTVGSVTFTGKEQIRHFFVTQQDNA